MRPLLAGFVLLGFLAGGLAWLSPASAGQVAGAGDALTASTTLVVNEIDYDQPSTDTAEFIEIKNVSAGAIDLDPYAVHLINGNAGGATQYAPSPIDLPSFSLAAGAYYVICGTGGTVPNCDLAVASFTIQNGDPDAVAVVLSGAVVDTISYGGNTGAPYTEGSGSTTDTTTANLGLSRFPDGTDSDDNSADVSRRCISPGQANVSGTSSCPAGATNTPTASPTASATPAATDTATATPSPSNTPTATATDTPTATDTSTATPSSTPSTTPSATTTPTATTTPSPTATVATPFEVTLSDPFGCTGPGDTLDVEAVFTNHGAVAIASVTFQANLPPELAGVPGSCTVSDGTDASCSVTATSVTWTGSWPGAPSAPANTITLGYQVTVAGAPPPGTVLCVDSSLSFDSGGPRRLEVNACGAVTCPLDPTAVHLAYFRARFDGTSVRLAWQTESEIDVLGFEVLRSSSPEGPFRPIHARPLPAIGAANRGASYHLLDRPGQGTFHYRLDALSGDGKRQQHGTAVLRVGPGSGPNLLYLPLASAGRAGAPLAWLRSPSSIWPD